MPIRVTREPADMGPPHEACFGCHAPTAFWYTKNDVACCRPCARLVSPADVPTKDAWIAAAVQRERATRRGGTA